MKAALNRSPRTWRARSTGLFVAASLVGCTPPQLPAWDFTDVPTGAYNSGMYNVDAAAWIEKRNNDVLVRYVSESPRTPPLTRPKFCVALSGGGLRAATFGMGVLLALYKHQLLDKVDLISGVSGGSYTLAWYFAQQYRGLSLDEMFNIDLKPGSGKQLNARDGSLDWVAQNADISDDVTDVAYPPLDLVFGFVPNLVLNGLFGSHTQTDFFVKHFYETRLAEIYLGSKTVLGFTEGHVLTVPDIVDFAKSRNLPGFIIGTTAWFDDDLNHYGGTLANTVFEFNSVRWGSDGFGYAPIQDSPLNLRELIATSGAAADLTGFQVGNATKLFTSTLNSDQGRYITSPNPIAAEQHYKGFLPLAWAYEPAVARSAEGFKVYLTDGGHSENLAAFSMVRRMCEQILIVDAEHDPNYTFGSYFKLKTALDREMNVELKVADIENPDDYKSMKFTESEHSQSPKIPRLLSDSPRLWDKFEPKEHGSVMRGTISGFPMTKEEERNPKQIQVLYVKLAKEDRPKKPQYDQYVGDMVERTQGKKCNENQSLIELATACPFPMQGTGLLNYSYENFRAYLDLGFFNVDAYITQCESQKHLDNPVMPGEPPVNDTHLDCNMPLFLK